jgi:hypothetical protein
VLFVNNEENEGATNFQFTCRRRLFRSPSMQTEKREKDAPFYRILAHVSFLLTAIVPLAAGATSVVCWMPFENAVSNALLSSRRPIPTLTIFFYDHFKLLLFVLFFSTVVLTAMSFYVMWRERDITCRIARQNIIAIAASAVAVAFLVMFIGATAAGVANATF